MFLEIFTFEIRLRLRRLSTWVYFAGFFAMAFLWMLGEGGGFKGGDTEFGLVFVNSPARLFLFITMLGHFGLLVTAALAGDAAHRDFQLGADPFFLTTPVGTRDYLLGRFAGAMAVLVAVYSSIGLGMLAGSFMPWLEAERFGPTMPWAYVHPYLVGTLPNAFFMGAFFFGIGALTRKRLPVYVAGVVAVIGYFLAAGMMAKIENETLAALVDPFGIMAAELATKHWTAAEQNTRFIPLTGAFLANRALWVAAGLAFLAFTVWRFRPGPRMRRPRAAPTAEPPAPALAAPAPSAARLPSPAAAPAPSAFARAALLLRHSAFELARTVKNVYFLALLVAGALYLLAVSEWIGMAYGTPTWPVTYQMIDHFGAMSRLIALLVITFCSGELVWRERDGRTAETVDSTPAPLPLFVASKILALLGVVVLLLALVLVCGVLNQAFRGYYRFELSRYFTALFGLLLADYLPWCVLAIAVHAVVGHKYLGHFVLVLLFVASRSAGLVGIYHPLWEFASGPVPVVSDMNGFGPFVWPFACFKAYWTAFAALLALAAGLFWTRGTDRGLRARIRNARARFGWPTRMAFAAAGVAFVSTGGFIFYNTNVLNEYRTPFQEEELPAEYERRYKGFENLPQPRITGLKVSVDIYPGEGKYEAKGRYTLENRMGQPIDEVYIVADLKKVRRLEFDRASEETLRDEERHFCARRLREPLAPGERCALEFEIVDDPQGFDSGGPSLTVVENGTFLTSGEFPSIGYDPDRELAGREDRKKHGLPPRAGMADPKDLLARMTSLFSPDSDWVDYEAVVSTSADQTAITAGSLVEEWMEGGRRFFRYRPDGRVSKMFPFLSGRYAVQRDRWKDVDIEVFHHPGHEYNVARMIESIRQSLAYTTRAFGPYPQRQIRVVEFPRYQAFAQSFPGTIPYSEAIGFIARVDRAAPESIDYPFYVTAHEVAHQWWGHQVVGANVQGSQMLSEALSEYSALMVMEKDFGPNRMRRFLRYDLDEYLSGRGYETENELPLSRVERQGYVYYQKGSLAMYALRDYIGEEALNAVLAEFLRSHRFQGPPYTTAEELLDRLRKAAPERLQGVIEDLFDTITLFENRAKSATCRELGDGRHEVKIQVESRKLRAGEKGEETEVALCDWIDIGVLDAEGEAFFLEKRLVDRNEMEFTLVVDRKPAQAGIDPLNKLIDRKPGDNTIKVKMEEPNAAGRR